GILTEHNQNGTHAALTSTNATLTTPKVVTSLNDTAGNEVFNITATVSAVNELTFANGATGNGPTISATGGDTNVDLNLAAKGPTGVIKLTQNSVNMLGAWQSWTPTWTNLTVGNAVQACKYIQIGKTVHFRVS